MAVLQIVINICGCQQPPGFNIYRQHFTRLHPALGHHLFRGVVVHANFRSNGEMAIFGDNVAGRTQTIAIQHTARIAAIGQHNPRRPVPGFQVHRVVFVKGPQIRIHVFDILPGRRNQQAHRPEQIHPAHQQYFQHIVEAAGIGAVHIDQRADVGQIRQ